MGNHSNKTDMQHLLKCRLIKSALCRNGVLINFLGFFCSDLSAKRSKDPIFACKSLFSLDNVIWGNLPQQQQQKKNKK